MTNIENNSEVQDIKELQKQLDKQFSWLGNFESLKEYFDVNQWSLSEFLSIYDGADEGDKDILIKYINEDIENEWLEERKKWFFILFKEKFPIKVKGKEKFSWVPEKNQKIEWIDENILEAESLMNDYPDIFQERLKDLGIAETKSKDIFVYTKDGDGHKKWEKISNKLGEVYKIVLNGEGYKVFLEAAKNKSSVEHARAIKLVEWFQESKFIVVEGLEDYKKSFDAVIDTHINEPNEDGNEKKHQLNVAVIREPWDGNTLNIDWNKFTYGDQQIDGDTKYIVDKNGFRIESTDLSDVQRNREYLMGRYKLEKDLRWVNKKLKPKEKELATLTSLKSYLEWKESEGDLPLGSKVEDVEVSLSVITDKYGGNNKVNTFIEALEEAPLDQEKQMKLTEVLDQRIDSDLAQLEIDMKPLLGKKEELEWGIERLDHDERARIEWMKDKIQLEDENAREMMDALRLLGMHLLPQSVFDHIIKIINEEGALKGAIKLRNNRWLSGKVDFWNLEVGQPSWETYRSILVQLINKALTWNPDSPHNVALFEKDGTWAIDPTEFKDNAINVRKVVTSTGEANKEKLEENLTKEVQVAREDVKQNVVQILDLDDPNAERSSRTQVG